MKGENPAIEPTCCGSLLEACQRPKLKAVKMEQELFANCDKLKELDDYCLPTAVVSFLPSANTRKRASASRETHRVGLLLTVAVSLYVRNLTSHARMVEPGGLRGLKIPPPPPNIKQKIHKIIILQISPDP